MKTRTLIAAAMLAAFAASAFADHNWPPLWDVDKRIELSDGGTLVVYKDGKTAVEDRYGRPAWFLKPGTTLQTRGGASIRIDSNETQRLGGAHPRLIVPA